MCSSGIKVKLMVVQDRERKIVAAIPCYDEEKFVGDVVRKTKGYVHEVVVIDDGSKDGTVQSAQAAGAIVVSHGAQKGYGSAISSCFKAAKDRNPFLSFLVAVCKEKRIGPKWCSR